MMRSSASNRIVRGLLSALLILALVPGVVGGPSPAFAGVTTANLKCLDFVDANTGFAAGTAGTILKTTDGGLTWNIVRAGDLLDFRSIDFMSATHGWAVSLEGTVVGTTNGGATWMTLSTDPLGPNYVLGRFYDVEFFSTSEGVIVGTAQDEPPFVFHTYNGGSGTWYRDVSAGTYEPPPELPSTPKLGLGEFYAVDYPVVGRAWAVGHDRYNGANKPVVWDWDETRTGTYWRAQTITGTGPLYDVDFVSTTLGIAVGSGGRTYRTVDSGVTWSQVLVGQTVDLKGVTWGTTGIAWAVGGSGRIFGTANSGVSWTAQTSPTAAALEDVAWLGGTTAVAVGASGTILRTTDGTTWQIPATPAGPQMTSVSSATHPLDVWVGATAVSAQWSATGTDLTGYGVVFDQLATTVPSVVTTTGTTGAFTASGSGTWWLHVAARDALARWSTPWHRAVLVDVTMPVTQFSPDAAGYAEAANVTLSATDAHAGVASVSYSVNGGSVTTVTGSSAIVSVSGVGTHDVAYYATDNAGNVAATKHADVIVRAASGPPEQDPVSGANRYATAIEAAKTTFGVGPMPAGPDGNRWVVVASGANWPDALAASGLAGALEAPLLLTQPDSLPSDVGAYVSALGASRAAVVGGTAAVSQSVRTQLAALVGGSANVKGYGASNRYATAELVASTAVNATGRSTWDKIAFLSTGGNYPDALAAAPLAAAIGRPLYLADPAAGVSNATVSAMRSAGVERVIVLGGTAVVSQTTVNRIKAAGITVGTDDRWAGANRYDTARVVAEKSIATGYLNAGETGIATGEGFADALAGGVAQGHAGGVLVLTESATLESYARKFLTDHRASIQTLRFFGGVGALSTQVRIDAVSVATVP